MKITIATINRIVIHEIANLDFFNKSKYVIYENIEE